MPCMEKYDGLAQCVSQYNVRTTNLSNIEKGKGTDSTSESQPWIKTTDLWPDPGSRIGKIGGKEFFKGPVLSLRALEMAIA